MGRWPVEPTAEEVIDLLEAENTDLRNEVSDLKAQVFELKAQLYARCVSCEVSSE